MLGVKGPGRWGEMPGVGGYYCPHVGTITQLAGDGGGVVRMVPLSNSPRWPGVSNPLTRLRDLRCMFWHQTQGQVLAAWWHLETFCLRTEVRWLLSGGSRHGR